MGRIQRKKSAKAKKKKQQKTGTKAPATKRADSRDSSQKAVAAGAVVKPVKKKPAAAPKKNQPAAGGAGSIVFEAARTGFSVGAAKAAIDCDGSSVLISGTGSSAPPTLGFAAASLAAEASRPVLSVSATFSFSSDATPRLRPASEGLCSPRISTRMRLLRGALRSGISTSRPNLAGVSTTLGIPRRTLAG